VDLAYEENPYELLRYMAKNSIAIEINLVSNEFILNVKKPPSFLIIQGIWRPW
jgi:hypothetical protein